MRTRRRFSFAAAMLALVAALVLIVAPAQAASNRQAQGRGVTSELLCESGLLTAATIDFSAAKNKGTIGGFFQIFGVGTSKFGNITGGTINPNSYSLTGTVNAFQCGGIPTSTLPAQATISGECGEGVIIHYTDTHGEVGDFRGNVICS